MLSSIHHLDYVVLPCRDLVRTRDFYRDVMGFQVQLESEEWIELRIGSVLLALSTRGSSSAPGPAVQLAFRVPPHHLDGCHRELVERGAEIVQPPQVIDRRVWALWQHRTLFFRDPEGNLLEIYSEIEVLAATTMDTSPSDGQPGR